MHHVEMQKSQSFSTGWIREIIEYWNASRLNTKMHQFEYKNLKVSQLGGSEK